jgi:hypothetical protein
LQDWERKMGTLPVVKNIAALLAIHFLAARSTAAVAQDFRYSRDSTTDGLRQKGTQL